MAFQQQTSLHRHHLSHFLTFRRLIISSQSN
jgi:hypothetical protein